MAAGWLTRVVEDEFVQERTQGHLLVRVEEEISWYREQQRRPTTPRRPSEATNDTTTTSRGGVEIGLTGNIGDQQQHGIQQHQLGSRVLKLFFTLALSRDCVAVADASVSSSDSEVYSRHNKDQPKPSAAKKK